MKRALLGCLCLLALANACTGPDPQSQHPDDESSVDSRILEDVVEFVFMVPGDGQMRAIRVSNFVQSLYLKACGEESLPHDETSGRLMQHMFPNLDLIRTKGLVENAPTGSGFPNSRDCSAAAAAVERQLPEIGGAMTLTEAWLAEVRKVQGDSRITSLKEPMRHCMAVRSSLRVGKDVPAAFLDAVNLAMSGHASTHDMMRYSRVYAHCAKKYFQSLEVALLALRPTVVRRSRQALIQVAGALSASGYTPYGQP